MVSTFVGIPTLTLYISPQSLIFYLNFFTFITGTDHFGSPIAVFDSKGRLVKEIVRSPFGQIIRDTNTAMDLSIDYAGGLIDQYTHLVHIGDRVYDPVLGQWMTPDWTRICKPGAMKSPTDVFSYRFNGNDPINKKKTENLMSGKILSL